MPDKSATKEELERAIFDLQAQRSVLGDAVVDHAVAALREQLAKLFAPSDAIAGGDERKIVTVMFVDISGFTQLAERMDAEEARGLVNACFERFVPVIQRYGGTIDKFLGDAIMALFGAPIAHENDPERALRTALKLISALKSFNIDRNLTLGLHIGVNSGPVIAGTVGTQARRDYSVMGDTVNVAARLEDACGEDEVLVGPETFRSTASLFEFEALPPIRLKGKSEPLPVYRLIGLAKGSPVESRRVAARVPLFGRERELGQIKAAWNRSHAGEGSLLCIIGEAGLGKSRLVSEARALGPSATWAETRALSYAEKMSYRMARDLLHALLGTTADQAPPEIDKMLRESISETPSKDFERIYPYLARVLEVPLEQAWSEQLELLSAEILQRHILDAFRLYVEKRATATPLALVWEDIHWADPSSLQVLEQLVSLVSAAPVLMIVVYRGDSSVRERMRELAERLPSKRVHIIELAPLTREESTDFVAAAGQIDNPETRRAILDRAEGNPFFLEELVRAVGDAREKTHNISDVPQTLQAVLTARIDSLPQASKRVLQRAAVIGRTFQEGILSHICRQQGEHSLHESLEELCRRTFIHPEDAVGSTTPDQVYAFHHAITHEVAYHSLLQVTRRDWHRLTGEAIETLLPDRLDEFSGILGRHFEQAGVRDKTIHYFVRAADRARATFSNSEAIAFYRSALLQTGEQGDKTDGAASKSERQLIVSLREGLGDVLVLNGEFETALDQFKHAQTLVAEADRITRSRLDRKVGSTWVLRRDFDQTFESLRLAEQELESDRSERGESWWNEWAQIQHERMHLFYWLGRWSELNELAASVQPDLEKRGTIMQRGKFFMMRALSLLSEHRYLAPESAVEYAERAVAITKDSNSPAELVHLKFALGFTHLWRGNLDNAILALGQALQLSEKVGDLVLQNRCLIYLAVANREAGEKTIAQQYAERAISLATKLEMIQYTAMANAIFAWVAWKNNDLPMVKAFASRALEEWHSMPDPYGFDWMALWPLIAVAWIEKDFARAIEYMRALFGPNQHPLPTALTTTVQRAIQCASNSPADVNSAIRAALDAAQNAHQI